MVLIPVPSVMRAAALLPVVAGHARSSDASGGRCAPGKPNRAGQARWQGHLLLAVAVVLWLALMDASLHAGSSMQQHPHALRHSDSGMPQLQELGRMLLARHASDHSSNPKSVTGRAITRACCS
jgi:hypothetical protein